MQEKTEFMETHKELIEEIEKPGVKYVDFLAFTFKLWDDQSPILMSLFAVDACFGACNLGAFNKFSYEGMTANRNVVPMGYVFISGNESAENWKRAWNFFHDRHSSFDPLTAAVSDGEKGIPKGMEKVFAVGKFPMLTACSHHLGGRLICHGKACWKMFHRLRLAPTFSKVVRIKASPDYTTLLSTVGAALERISDSK